MNAATAFNAPEAAEYLRVSPKTLAKWRWTGGGPTYVQAGRRVLYLKEDLDAWLGAHKRRSTSDIGNAARVA